MNKPNSKQIVRLRRLVTRDLEIMRGTAVFKGTRIPVDLVADMLAQGATAKEILDGYPTLNEEMLSLAPLWFARFSHGHIPAAKRINRSFPVGHLDTGS